MSRWFKYLLLAVALMLGAVEAEAVHSRRLLADLDSTLTVLPSGDIVVQYFFINTN